LNLAEPDFAPQLRPNLSGQYDGQVVANKRPRLSLAEEHNGSQEREDRSIKLPSPNLLEILEPVEIVLLLQPALHAKLRQDGHHLAQGEPGKLSGHPE
jgi:hypothetical protein